MQDRRLARDLAIAVENVSAALKNLLPGNDRVAVIQSRGSKVDALNCVRPAKQDLSVIQLVQIVRVSQLDVRNDIALQAFLSGYNMRAGESERAGSARGAYPAARRHSMKKKGGA